MVKFGLSRSVHIRFYPPSSPQYLRSVHVSLERSSSGRKEKKKKARRNSRLILCYLLYLLHLIFIINNNIPLCLLLLVRPGGYIVKLCDFCFYKLIGKLTVFFTGSGVHLTYSNSGLFHYHHTEPRLSIFLKRL
jgi:hypothetical protein